MKTLFNSRSLLPRTQARRRGFTIIELLVAIGVTALLVTLMFTILTNILNVWNRSSGTLTTGNQARIVMDALSQDLQGAIMRRDDNVWMAATIQRDQTGVGDAQITNASWTATSKPTGAAGSLEINPTELRLEDYRFGQAGVWFRFFTVVPAQNSGNLQQASAPRAVSYQMTRRRIGAAASPQFSYQLFRSEVRPYHNNVATTALNSVFALGYNLFMPTGAPSYNSASASSGDAGNVRRAPVTGIIANDVIDFGVRLYELDALGNEVEIFPVDRRGGGAVLRTAFAASVDTTRSQPNPVMASTATSYGFPVAADIMVRILTNEGVRRIAALEAGNITRPPEFGSDAEYWWSLAIQHSQVFTRRVQIRSTPL